MANFFEKLCEAVHLRVDFFGKLREAVYLKVNFFHLLPKCRDIEVRIRKWQAIIVIVKVREIRKTGGYKMNSDEVDTICAARKANHKHKWENPSRPFRHASALILRHKYIGDMNLWRA